MDGYPMHPTLDIRLDWHHNQARQVNFVMVGDINPNADAS
jgi:hypothetical protein